MIDTKLYTSILQSLSQIASTVYDNEDLFMEKFAKYGDTLMGLNGIYFGSETIKFNYILECGQHIGDSIKIGEFVEWLGTLD